MKASFAAPCRRTPSSAPCASKAIRRRACQPVLPSDVGWKSLFATHTPSALQFASRRCQLVAEESRGVPAGQSSSRRVPPTAPPTRAQNRAPPPSLRTCCLNSCPRAVRCALLGVDQAACGGLHRCATALAELCRRPAHPPTVFWRNFWRTRHSQPRRRWSVGRDWWNKAAKCWRRQDLGLPTVPWSGLSAL